ncbi:MAG: hypothetical protein JWO77_3322 [Ilumatobacteraceae bacterium]|nr:hypothetical protein [Ilumatobacteraceae bacterium]
MRGTKVRKLAVLVIVGVLVASLVKKLRGDPAPQFANHPTVRGGAAADPIRQPGPAAKAAPADPTRPSPSAETRLVAAPEDPTVPAPEPTLAAEPGEQVWVKPVDGTCPDGYPIKAKVKSGIFHQPGGLAYDRTSPDRCYPDVASAEADGLRAAKR